MKIKLFANYEISKNLLKRFRENYLIQDSDLTFTLDDDYDVAVIFNGTHENLKPNIIKIGVVQEPSWSPVWCGNDFFNICDYVLVHDASLFNLNPKVNVIETPSYMWFHDHVPYSFFSDNYGFKKEKSLSIVVSNLGMDIPNTNYKKRMGLLEKILASDLDIDIFGKGLNISDERYKGEVTHKYSALLPYTYSIAIENSCEKNYISEKFIDCTLCNTKPIYYGAPNIDEIYSWYEPLDLDGADVISDIKNIVSKKDITFHQENISDFNTYFLDCNLYEKIKEICLQ